MVEETRIKVWDVAIRVFHWSLVFLFFVAYFSGDDESVLHVYAGYGVVALVVFRIVWGLVGTKHARFADFIFGPTATLRYISSLASSKPLHYVGHNPLAGWMIVALLVCLLGACWSGLKAYGEQGHGPLARNETRAIPTAMADDHEREQRSERRRREDKTEDEHFWEEIHEALSNLTLFLVFLHVTGAVISSWLHRENLIKAMVTGYKTRRTP